MVGNDSQLKEAETGRRWAGTLGAGPELLSF